VREFVTPGAVVWDVGANVGLFSFAAANMAGPGGLVVALEPDAWLVATFAAQCARSTGRLSASKGRTCRGGLRRLRSDVLPRARSRAANHLAEFGTTQTGGSREQQLVVAVTLDWLMDSMPAPSVVKIDVEGAELEVLKGASLLFETVRRSSSAK